MTADDSHNERIKLFATLVNTAAGSCFTLGVVAPTAASLFYQSSGLQPLKLVLGGIIWTTAAGLLHLCAQAILGRLRHD
jgi:hypothetical protein